MPKEKQKQAEAKKLRSRIILAARGKGLSKEQLYQVMPSWGFPLTLSKYGIQELTQIMNCLTGVKVSYDKKYPGVVWKPAPGMATVAQQLFVIGLYRYYAKLKRIPKDKQFKAFHSWLKKYGHVDHVGFCRKSHASKIIFMIQQEIRTTYGERALEQFLNQQKAYKKNDKKGAAHGNSK